MKTDRDIVTELKVEFRNVIESLNSIKSDIKELVQAMQVNITEVKLAQQDINSIKLRCDCERVKIDKLEIRVNELEKKQSWLLAKIGTITAIISGAITWLIK
jgi:predicted metalloenzyme YecM